MVIVAWHTGRAQQSLQLLHNHVPHAVSSGQAALVGPLPAEQNLNVSLVLPLRNQAGLTSLLGRLYDPTSPDYRHFLTVEQFTEQFGPTAEDYQAVVAFAQASGFTVTNTPANRLVVPINGPVAQIDKAFNLTMQVYRHPTENRTFFSPDREPALNLGVPVAHIAGLNDFSIPRPAVKLAALGQAIANVTGSGPGGSYLGSDMRAAYYGGTTLTGNGQAVGVLEFGGYNLSDVNATFSNAGQSYNVPINNVLLDGATGAPQGQDAEQVLDIVQAIGMAPGLSQVRVYIGAGLDDANILNAMASENIAKQLSCSWGWRPDDPLTDDVFFEEFAAQGQSFFAASGDDGAFDAAINPFFYPGEDDYVTAVGATHLTTNGAGGAWVSEAAWNSGGGGSGGGISPDGIAIPSWQAGVANSSNGGSTTLRNVPDVAMEGDFDNYYCALGSCGGGAAGTSFAAPRWAGFIALVNQQAVEAGTAPLGGVGSINPGLYSIGEGPSFGSDLHDITAGNNDTEGQPVWFSAVPGYDLVTGWGSANGQSLIDALAGPQVPGFWIASSSGNLSVNQGASSATTITVTDAGGFTGTVNLAVTSALPTGVTAAWGTNPTTGSSVLTLTASSSAPSATATVTITGTSGALTVTAKFAVSVHAPSFALSSSPATLTINQGASGTSTVTVNPLYGFTGSVNLAVTSALPSGVTASWGTNPTTGSSVLTLTASSSAPFGGAILTITGTSGTLTATTTLKLTVYAPDFILSAGSLNIGQGSSGTTYVYVNPEYGFSGSVNLAVSGLPSGVTASWNPNPTAGISALTLTASAAAAAGTTTLTITGTSGSLTTTTTLTLGVFAPSFTLLVPSSLTIGQGSSGTAYVYVTPQYGFTGTINLAATGLPSGVTASFAPNPTTGTSILTLTASSTASLGTATLTVTGTSGSLTATTALSLGVYVPTFTLAATNLNLVQGTSGTSSVYVNPQYGFAGSVNLAVTGLPTGVTASWSPNPTTGASTLTLTANSTATLGTSTLIVTGTFGNLIVSTTLNLGVFVPSFTLSGSSSVSLGQGSSGTATVYVTPQFGFAGTVSLAVSGLPSGVTASWSPNPTTGASSLTLTAGPTASLGSTTLTVTGTSGKLTATTTLTLGVYVPSFTLLDSNVSLGQGSSGTTYVNVYPQYGFTGSVNLAVSGLPSGVTASFAPNPTNGNSVLTLTASSTVSLGQYNLTVTGTSGNLTATIALTLGVYAPSFTLSDYSSVSVGQGSSVTSTVSVNPQYGFTGSVNLAVTGLPSGVTASFAPNPTATGSSVLTLTANSTATPGTTTLTITGTSGSLHSTTTLTLGVSAPSFTLSDYTSVSIGQGGSGTSTLYVNSQYGFTGSVNLAVSGLPSGVTASFAPNPTATGSSLLTLTAASTAIAGTTTLTVTGTSGTVTASTTLTLGVYAPSFTLSDYNSVSIGQGSSGTSLLYVTSQYGFTGSVNLAVTGLPSGVTASFAPNPTTGSSVLTLTASSTSSLGQYNVTIVGTAGNLTASTILNLAVYVPSFTLSDYSSLSIGQGSSGTSYVYVNPQYGFAGSVNLAVTGLPSGVTASFAPNPTTGTSLLTLAASSTASRGQYNVTIVGTSGGLTESTTITLGVYASSFTLTDYSSLSIGPGSSGTNYVNVTPLYGFTGSVSLAVSGLPSGVTASFAPNPTTGGNVALTLTASSTASLGQYNVTVTGTSGSLTATAILTLGIYVPSFTLTSYYNVAIDLGASGAAPIYVNPQYGFTGSVSLAASGLPSGVTASFSPNPVATGSSILTLTASNTAASGVYTVTITGTSGTQTATTTVSLTLYPQSFTLSDAPGQLSLAQGASGSSTLYVTGLYGFGGSVSFAASGLPGGVSASFAPNPTATGSSVLTLTASSAATPGTATVTVTGVSGALTATTFLTVTVRTAPATTSTTLAVISGGAPATSVASSSMVTLTAAVSAGSTPLTTGQVNFCDAAATYCEDIHRLGTAQLTSAGTAVLRFFPGMGSHSYKAVFVGTHTSATSSSSASALTVTASNASTTTIASSGSVGNYSLTATVTAQGLLSPSGNASFLDTSDANSVLGTAALGQGKTALSWLNPQSPAMGSTSYAIATGDINGDGIPDLAVANVGSNSVTILLGKGDGTFTPTAVSPATGSDPSAIVVADFNGDGKPDLAVANEYSNSLTILLGNGDGTFAASASPATGSEPGSIAAGDFNGDGIPDLAVVNEFGNTVSILLGNGDGTFTPAASPATGFYPSSVAVGDFNGDGILDLAVANESSSTVTILLGNGDGTFTPSPVSPQTGIDSISIVVGDFNGDGIPDLAVSNEGSDTVTVLLGNGNGTFTPAASPAPGLNPTSIAVGDFNADGKPDLAVDLEGSNTVMTLLGNGDGTFAAAGTASTGSAPWAIVAGHFNENGNPGLAVTNYYGSTVTVLTAQLTQTATATATGVSLAGQGVHRIDASYPGDSNYSSSVSSTAGLTAQPATPTVLVTPSSSSITTAQALTVTVAVGDGSGNPTPTGSVTLTSGSYVSSATALSSGSATINIAAGSLALGAHTLTVSYTPDSNSSSTYNSATGSSSVTVTVNRTTPAVSWATPAAIAYGTALSATQLNASSTVAGAFAYSPALGTVLGAGQQTLTATFTPTDATDYTTAATSVTLTVNKAAPTISWATPAAIAYGTALSATQLNAASAVAGAFAYSPALGTVPGAGPQTLTATFTPTDATDYTTAAASVTLTVNKATPTVLVTPSPSSITTAQPLFVTVAVNGGSGNPTPTGSVRLTSGPYTSAATTLSSGSATINIPGGSLAAGADTLTASYSPDSSSASNYNGASGSNSIIVNALTVTTLTLSANPASSAYGQQVVLSAALSPYSTQSSSTNGETVSFSDGSTSLGTGSLSSGVATLIVPALPTGTDSLTAAYGGDTSFTASASNTLPYIVSPIAPTIAFSVPNHTYGDAPFTASATSNSPGAIAYSVVSGPATVSSATVTLTGVGTAMLQASQAASGNYAAATQNATFTIAAGSQTIAFTAPASPINFGAAPVSLSASASSGLGVTFSVLSGPALVSGGALTITGAGTIVVAADQPGNANYTAAAEMTRSITVNKAAPSVGLTASPNPVLLQNAVTLTATVASSADTPTGSVVFSEGGTPLGTANLSGGLATLTLSTIAAGSNSITAVYSGDGNFNSVTSAAVSETVEDFTLTTNSASQTVQPGAAATYTFPMSLSGGTTLPAAVALSVSGLPTGFTGTFSPASLAVGSAATSVTLTIQVPQTAMLEKNVPAGNGIPLVAFGILLLPLAGRSRRSKSWLRRLVVIAMMLAGAGGVATLIGCGGGGSSGGESSQPQTYNLSVIATSGTLSHSIPVTLMVQ